MKERKKPNLVMVSIVYLAGIFMGAIDTGIVTPARIIIQSDLNTDPQTGIWMITIYTLAYAASIPIMGKLADKFGRKYVYLICITLFGFGSLLCGLSESVGGFPLLLVARVIQALGGGGIIPIATAEFGTSFPEEKRGMALGLVGGVFGIANIFGASAGSLILDIFGYSNWQFIFYINIPITIFIVTIGVFILRNNKEEDKRKLDILGILTLTVMILSLLYGLKNLDFFNVKTFGNLNVYPFLIAFVALIPIFIYIERKAEDPVMNLKYFTNRNILITLIISFLSGFIMMGMIFVPQFSENALKIVTGSGGYLVILLGLFAGIAAPVSGKLIDKFGVKKVLAFGFGISIVGALFLIFVTIAIPNLLTVGISLGLLGVGIGFTMGTPLNYMMLANTKNKESNSALATLSLVRSIGTAIAPAIMVGFIANAGMLVQSNVMDLLPKEINVPPLPYAKEINTQVNSLKENKQMKDQITSMEFPNLDEVGTVKIDMGGNSNYKMPKKLQELMQNSDVTTITDNTITLTKSMFEEMTPPIIANIQSGVTKGMEGIGTGESEISSAILKLEEGRNGISQGIAGMEKGLSGQAMILGMLENISRTFEKMGNPPFPPNMTLVDMIPGDVKAKIPMPIINDLSKITSVGNLNSKIVEMQGEIASLNSEIESSKKSREDMTITIRTMEGTRSELQRLLREMTILKEAVPGAFQEGENSYIERIRDKGEEIEKVFQKTINEGFRSIYLTVVVAAALALILLIFYRERKRDEHES